MGDDSLNPERLALSITDSHSAESLAGKACVSSDDAPGEGGEGVCLTNCSHIGGVR
jgi:hypothetical protein